MILEMDCGNTLIKWRLLSALRDVQPYSGCAKSDAELLEQLGNLPDITLRCCRLVSVRSDEETQRTVEALRARYSLKVFQVSPAASCCGVSNGYQDYRQLGLDRWLAIVAAYNLSGHACLVIDLGTAITVDLVSATGQHLGGYICPGLALMRAQLHSHTRRIRYEGDQAILAASSLAPGRSTAEAVERGCLQMLRGFVLGQCAQAAEWFGEGFEVFLTGGDAAVVADAWPGARLVADLVFTGLALACPVEGE